MEAWGAVASSLALTLISFLLLASALGKWYRYPFVVGDVWRPPHIARPTWRRLFLGASVCEALLGIALFVAPSLVMAAGVLFYLVCATAYGVAALRAKADCGCGLPLLSRLPERPAMLVVRNTLLGLLVMSAAAGVAAYGRGEPYYAVWLGLVPLLLVLAPALMRVTALAVLWRRALHEEASP